MYFFKTYAETRITGFIEGGGGREYFSCPNQDICVQDCHMEVNIPCRQFILH